MFEMFSLSFMLHAFIATVIMGTLLSYLGVHVIGRGIVFVDLALGQISSLGVAFAQFMHTGEEWIPIAFTLLGAVLLSLIHITDRRLKLEAIIGIIYVVAAAVTVLVISKTPHGEADIQEVLFGAVLAVNYADLVQLGVIFGIIGVLHVVFHKPILRLTERMESGKPADFTLKERAWNFFFYLSIGLAIVYAVRIGGVMPVFAFLVIPSVSAVTIARKGWVVIVLAILISVLASYGGLLFSYTWDFPAGSSLVAVLGGLYVVALFVRTARGRIMGGSRRPASSA